MHLLCKSSENNSKQQRRPHLSLQLYQITKFTCWLILIKNSTQKKKFANSKRAIASSFYYISIQKMYIFMPFVFTCNRKQVNWKENILYAWAAMVVLVCLKHTISDYVTRAHLWENFMPCFLFFLLLYCVRLGYFGMLNGIIMFRWVE